MECGLVQARFPNLSLWRSSHADSPCSAAQFPSAVHSYTITNWQLMLKDFEKKLQPVEIGALGSSSCVSNTAARHLCLFQSSRWKADWQRPHPPDLLVIQGIHCDFWAQAVRGSYRALCHAARAQRLQRPQRLQRAYAPATTLRQLNPEAPKGVNHLAFMVYTSNQSRAAPVRCRD